MRIKKKAITLALAGSLILASGPIPAYAVSGTWKHNVKGWWYEYSDGSYARSTWERLGGKWYYFSANGYLVTGWKQISGKWYYFDSSGAMQTGWKKISGKWHYFDSSGAMQTGWKKISGKWYYFDSSGAMQTGWKKISGKWYYFDSSGAMQTGWKKISGKWYCFNSSGAMQTGWKKISGKWYFFNSSGVMQTGWLSRGEDVYYFDSSGRMMTGEVLIDEIVYTFDEEGKLQPHIHDYITIVEEKTIPATCEVDGVTVKKCSCGEEISFTEKATGHDFEGAEWVPLDPNDPPCKERVMQRHCLNEGCTASETKTVPATTAHTIATKNGYAATCENPGKTDGTYCSVCGEVITKQKKIKAIGHDMPENWTVTKEATCTEPGERIKSCKREGCAHQVQEEIPAKGHTRKYVAAVPATEDHVGYTEGYVCSVCKEILEGCEEIPVTMPHTHTWAWMIDKTATCGEDGIEHQECTCGAKQNENTIIPATGEHNWTWITDMESTCTNVGYKHEECTVCHATRSTNTEIPAKGHKAEYKEAVPATETQIGYTAGYYCPVCETYIEGHEEIPVLNHEHTYGDWIIDTPATCGTDGLKYQVCACGHREEETIPKTGNHDWDVDNAIITEFATCQKSGTKQCKCKNCSETYDFLYGPDETAHTFSVFVEHHDATDCKDQDYDIYACGNEGCTETRTYYSSYGAHTYDWVDSETDENIQERRCTVCGAAESDPVETREKPLKNHDGDCVWDEGEEIKAPTCQEYGQRLCHCTIEGCRCTKTENINPLPHNFDDTKCRIVYMNGGPTCEKSDIGYVYCVNCDTECKEVVFDALGHDFDEGIIVDYEPATCTKDGYVVRQCTRCSATKKYTINATGEHTLEVVPAKAPTCCEPGNYEYTKCSVCGETLSGDDTVIPATGNHDLVTETITRHHDAGETDTIEVIYDDPNKNEINGSRLSGASHWIPAEGYDDPVYGWATKCSVCGTEYFGYEDFIQHDTCADHEAIPVTETVTCNKCGITYSSIQEFRKNDPCVKYNYNGALLTDNLDYTVNTFDSTDFGHDDVVKWPVRCDVCGEIYKSFQDYIENDEHAMERWYGNIHAGWHYYHQLICGYIHYDPIKVNTTITYDAYDEQVEITHCKHCSEMNSERSLLDKSTLTGTITEPSAISLKRNVNTLIPKYNMPEYEYIDGYRTICKTCNTEYLGLNDYLLHDTCNGDDLDYVSDDHNFTNRSYLCDVTVDGVPAMTLDDWDASLGTYAHWVVYRTTVLANRIKPFELH